MTKIEITEGSIEEMNSIAEFLLRRGFTPVYGMEASDWHKDQFGVHDHGGGWRSFKGDREWRCVEPIPRELIESNFKLPSSVRICWFPTIPSVGISLASDSTYATITSDALQEQVAQSMVGFDIGTDD